MAINKLILGDNLEILKGVEMGSEVIQGDWICCNFTKIW
jgi:hypothetical protein